MYVGFSAAMACSARPTEQSRLEAAIALFRAEASASGYVVEEIRLCLPGQNVGMTPRILIAQQTASTSQSAIYTPMNFEQRFRSPMPSGPLVATDSSLLAATIPNRSSHFATFAPASVSSSLTGMKRTASGSVILNPISVPAPLSTSDYEALHDPSDQMTHARLNDCSRNSIPSFSTKPGPALASHVASKDRLKFSKSPSFSFKSKESPKVAPVSDNGLSCIKDAENNRPGHNYTSEKKHSKIKKDKSVMLNLRQKYSTETTFNNECSPQSKSPSPEKVHDEIDELFMRKRNVYNDTQLREKEDQIERKQDNDTTISKHQNVPESHVQLFLSSVATITARELAGSKKSLVAKEEVDSDHKERQTPVEGNSVINSGSSNDMGRQMPIHERSKSPNKKEATLFKRTAASASRRFRDGLEKKTSKATMSPARPFKCTRCPSSFDRQGHLHVHILAVHEKQKPFSCDLCCSSFGHSSSLLRHMRTVHQAKPPIGSGRFGSKFRNGQRNSSSGSSSSESCDSSKSDEEYYSKHFRCSVCRQTFRRVALLNRHVALRHPSNARNNSVKS